MYFDKFALVLASLAACASAFGVGGGFGGGDQNGPPQPFDFGYEARDEQGNAHFRSESGDQSGNVKGAYGYTDNQGLYRKVEYVANAGGFRANVKTNEPGTDGKESPADVNMAAQSPPAGVQQKAGGGLGGGFGGGSWSGGFGGQGVRSGKSGY